MTTPLRLTVVLTHPIQYYTPWFRDIERHAPEIALTVVYATRPTPEQQGVGFDRAFEWDIPLTEGYRSITVRQAKPGDRVDSGYFTGLDVPEIGAAIEKTEPDVALITGWYSISLVRALAACRRLGVPTLYRGDSHLLSGPTGWRRPFWFLKTRFLLRRFDGFLATGRRADEYLRAHEIPAYRIFHVPHAIDNEFFARSAAPFEAPEKRAASRRRFGIEPDAFVPLFVGKFTESKRPLHLVRAVARLGRGVSMLAVGAGPLEAEMRSEAAQLGVDLKMIGFLNQTELGEAYAVADCLALPSDFRETWGLVVNEALATGLPCVVSDAVGCAPDLLREGETGYLSPLDDVAGLAASLDKIRARKAARYDWRPRCRETVADYSFEAMTLGLVRACRSVVRRSPGSEPDGNRSPVRIIACCGQMVSVGGVERMTFLMLRVVRSHGARVHCIVNGWENFRITPMADEIGATWSVGPYWHTLTRRRVTPAKAAKMVWELFRVSTDLLREARRLRATHVFVPDFLTALRNGPALLWLRARGVRVIAKLGNAPELGAFYRLLWRWAVNPLIDLFICNSEFTRRELLAHGIPPAKALTIPNATPIRREPWNAEGDRIPGRVIYVGQIIPDKGLDLLLEAIALVRARGIDATLDVVGEMGGWEPASHLGYHASVRERASRPDLRDAVTFLGYREDVPTLMSRASLHCCPSRPEIREAFGLVVLEAKLSGLPSVVAPSGNLPDLVEHRETGWVCAQATPASLADGLLFFLTDPARLEAARKAARVSASAFSADRFAEAWTHTFSATLKEPVCA